MDNIFGIGLPEFILILVIAGMVMGPERIVRMARTLGVMTARLQGVSRSFFRQINAELDSVDEDGQLRSTVEELNTLRREMTNLRNEVITLATGTAAESKQAIQQLKQEAEHSILPPELKAGLIKPQATSVEPGGKVIRPPLLFESESKPTHVSSKSNGIPSNERQSALPKRVEVSEDPDA